jgi:hypothetical protein
MPNTLLLYIQLTSVETVGTQPIETNQHRHSYRLTTAAQRNATLLPVQTGCEALGCRRPQRGVGRPDERDTCQVRYSLLTHSHSHKPQMNHEPRAVDNFDRTTTTTTTTRDHMATTTTTAPPTTAASNCLWGENREHRGGTAAMTPRSMTQHKY